MPLMVNKSVIFFPETVYSFRRSLFRRKKRVREPTHYHTDFEKTFSSLTEATDPTLVDAIVRRKSRMSRHWGLS
jgi:hypothetical protein